MIKSTKQTLLTLALVMAISQQMQATEKSSEILNNQQETLQTTSHSDDNPPQEKVWAKDPGTYSGILNSRNYCIPESNCSYGDGFENFTLEDIENLSSGCSPDGYGDFTNLSTQLQVGETFTVSWSAEYNDNFVSLWIDYDQDMEFDEEERLITDFSLETSGQIYTAEFLLPLDALEGETILRIRGNWQNSAEDPCMDYTYGETEDYTVFISNTPLPANVGIESLTLPVVAQPGNVTPEAVVKNYGIETQSFPVELTIGNYSSTIQVTDLAPGDEISVTFDIWNATPGTYEALACTQLEGDEYTGNDCEDATVTIINDISAYGYVATDPMDQFDDSWVAFDVNNPGALIKIADANSNSTILSTTVVGENIYCTENNGGVYVFNLTTGAYDMVASGTQYLGIDFDGETFYLTSGSELFTLDIQTGETEFVGSFANAACDITSIAINSIGEMYGIDLGTNELYQINKDNAVTTLIGNLGDYFSYHDDVSFDKTTDVLYFFGATGSNNTGLYTVNTNTGFATLIGNMQNNVQMPGLAVLSPGAYLLPPQNLTIIVDEYDALLTWEAPNGGDVITYNIYRDNILIGTIPDLAYLDENLEPGIYSYNVTAVYDEEESEPAGPVEAIIGNPELVVNLESIDAVIEMGESEAFELVIRNDGNLDLEFDLAAYYMPQSASNPVAQEITPEEYNQLASARFGENWRELLDSNEIIYSPEGTDEYCEVSGNCNFDDGLNDFILGEIENTNSGCSSGGYGDFTNLSTSLDGGMTYDVTVSSGYMDNYLTVWVDLNQDEIFDEDEKLIDGFYLEMAGESYTAQLPIPMDAPNGETRLRAVSSWMEPAEGPCGSLGFGEAEDYTVSIGTMAPWLNIAPQSGMIVPGDSTIVTVTLNSAELDPMEYMSNIEIMTNDSNNMVSMIPVNLMVIEQGLSNFFPVWDSPFNPMSVFLIGAQLDSADLQLGDEIGIFDIDSSSGEEICVGAGLVIYPVSPENILEITVSMDDGSNPDEANGFAPGNEMIFKIWSPLTGEVDSVNVSFPNTGFDEVFTPLGTAIAEIEGFAMITQPLTLLEGWNLISSKASPHNKNMMAVFEPLMDMGLLKKVVDEDGGTLVYLPYPEPEGRWVNSIGDMDMYKGYYVKVTESVDISVDGMPMEMPMEIPFDAGWNIMSYPVETPQNALELVQPLIDANNLYKMIDEAGGVIQYLPFPEPNGTWINTIGDLENGQGYYIKVFDSTSLMIEETPGMKSLTAFKGSAAITEYFEPVYENNPYMPMHFILYTNGNLEAGDEVGIFDGDVCVGASVFDGNTENMTITVTSMDDPDSEEIDGYISGNNFEVKVWKSGVVYDEVEIETLTGPETFTPLESYIGNITETITGIGESSSQSANLEIYPNPARDLINISLYTEKSVNTSLGLYRLDGTLVRDIYDGTIMSGNQSIKAGLNGIAPGVYILKTTFDENLENTQIKKLVIR